MKGNFKPKTMKTIQLFVAAAVVALAASCSSKPAEPAATETPAVEETTPAAPDTTAVTPADTTAAAQ
jgi:putative tryptophan/tyrosine transport system substrate-binding protein